MNSGVLAKSLAKSLYRSVSIWGLTTLFLSWANVGSARPTSPSSSALSPGPQQVMAGCQASSKAISASNWQITAPREPNWTKPDEIVQIGLRNSQGADVSNDRVVARVLAPDGSLAAAYPTVNRDRYTYLTYPLDFSGSKPTQAGTYTVILDVNGRSVLCDRFVVAQPSLIDTAFDDDLTGRKLELDLETFLTSDQSASESLLLASNANNAHNRLFALSSPSKPFTGGLNLDTENLLSPDLNPIVKETASSENSESCFYARGSQDLQEFQEFMGCTLSSFHINKPVGTWDIVGKSKNSTFLNPNLNTGRVKTIPKVVEPSSVLALLFLTTLTCIERRKK